MFIEIREMTIQDYEAVYALWLASDGVDLSDADSKEGIKHFSNTDSLLGRPCAATMGGEAISITWPWLKITAGRVLVNRW